MQNQNIEFAKQMFGALNPKEIEEIMKEFNNNLDAALDKLTQINTRKINLFITNMSKKYKAINTKEIEKKFEENSYDTEKTEKMLEEMHNNNLRLKLLSKYSVKYPEMISSKEINEIIEKQKMDENLIDQQLQQIFRENLKNEMQSNFEILTEKEVIDCLEKSKWIRSESRIACLLLKQKKEEKEKKKREEEKISTKKTDKNYNQTHIEKMMNFTGCNFSSAYSILTKNNWDLNLSVNSYFDSQYETDPQDLSTSGTEKNEDFVEKHKPEIKLLRGMFPEESIVKKKKNHSFIY